MVVRNCTFSAKTYRSTVRRRRTSILVEDKKRTVIIKNKSKLENVAIANALQLEAARRHASLFPL